jgi:hypothetical protein
MPRGARLAEAAFFAVVLLGGLWLFPVQVLRPDLSRLPGCLDTRFNLYVLEHGWRYLCGLDEALWTAPFFYPEPNTLAFSDSHLGTLPLFALFRAAGLDREAALQGWYLSLFALNFATAAVALRRLRLSTVGTAAGAYVFAFGLPLAGQPDHLQLLPLFPVPLAFLFAARAAECGRVRDWLGLGTFVVWQHYCAIYLGYFLALLVTAFIVVRRHQVRGPFPRPTGPDVRAALSGLALPALGMIPLLLPYVEVYWQQRHVLACDTVLALLPRPRSWASAPPSSRWWSFLFAAELEAPWEQQLFLGAVPLAALLLVPLALLVRRGRGGREPAVAAAAAFAVVFALTLHLGPWRPYALLLKMPGVAAIRAVSRVAVVMTFPAGMVAGHWITVAQRRLAVRRGAVSAFLAALSLLALVMADQAIRGDAVPCIDKCEVQERARRLAAAARRIDPGLKLLCNSRVDPADLARGPLYAEVSRELDGILAAQLLGVPALNGYSGRTPPSWEPIRSQQAIEQWKQSVRDRVGETRLRQQPWYAHNGFRGLATVGGLDERPGVSYTVATAALPPEACRARLAAVAPPARLPAGDRSALAVDVTNLGPASWPALGPGPGLYRVGLAYRWLTDDGRPLSGRGRNRFRPEGDVPPGATTRVNVILLPPTEPGRYVLELDLVEEGVTWFADAGNPPLRLPVEIAPAG